MMKKEYKNPEMEIIKIATQRMLADSKMGFGDPTGTMDSPGLDDTNMFGF